MRLFISNAGRCLAMLFGLVCGAAAADLPKTELLLPGGTLYTVETRAYRSLHLPIGWTVLAGSYSEDSQSLALLLTGIHSSSSSKPGVKEGPLNKLIRTWKPSPHVILLNRQTGAPVRSWPVTLAHGVSHWVLSWTSPSEVRLSASPESETAVDLSTASCPAILAQTRVLSKSIRFVREASACSTPPDPTDTYRLLRGDDPRPEILWEYHVLASTAACEAPYACYSGQTTAFLSIGEQHFLMWDADLYAMRDTPDGYQVSLVTQLLPEFSRPWGIAAHDTVLNALDVETRNVSSPASAQYTVPSVGRTQLVAQNFCPTRSFNAVVTVGAVKKSLMVPAGDQVGPTDIGPAEDDSTEKPEPKGDTSSVDSASSDGKAEGARGYTPLLVTVEWTSFHHVSDPVHCSSPYTLTPYTTGILVSINESATHTLQCDIAFQEGH